MRETGCMRSRWPILTLLCVLASLLVPGIASAHAAGSAENRVWAFDLAEQVHVAGQHALTLDLHQGYELAEYDLASDSLLAAKRGSRSLADLVGKNGGKNRVTLRSPSQKMEVDLAGKAHGGVPTPHAKVSPRNPHAPNQPAYNTKGAPVIEATQQDIRTVRRFLERQGGN